MLFEMNEDIARIGLQASMKRIFSKTHTKLIVEFDSKQTETALQTKPVVIVANHPYDADVVSLFASLPSRSDAYLIFSSAFYGICPALNHHTIPVYIDHHNRHKRKLVFMGALLRFFHPRRTYDLQEEHEKNVESIHMASNKLDAGGLVAIFPGRRSPDGTWFSGVGHMIAGVNDRKKISIVFAHISGTGNKDYLRLVPWIQKLLPAISVFFSEPYAYLDVLGQRDDGKRITRKLQEQYNRWRNLLQLAS